MTGPNRAQVLMLLVGVAAVGLGVRLWGATAIPGAPAAAATADQPAAYPVVTVAPLPRSFRPVVHGYGVLQADARNLRSVTMATVGVVRAVDVLPGERVAKGQTLFEVEPDPLAYLAYQQAVSAAKLARAEVARLAAQRADNLATVSQVETADKALADAEAAVDVARRQGAAGGAEVLRAPVEGIVTALGAGIGDRPAVGTPLATISPANAAAVTLGVEPGEARLVRGGDVVRVRVVQHGARERTGRVTVVGAALEKTTRLVTVSATLDEKGFGDVPAGSAVEADIETRPIEAFAVPRAAIVRDADGTAVFEVRGRTAHRVPVVIEVDEGSRVGVSGALDRARPVVAAGAYELAEGVTVTEQKP